MKLKSIFSILIAVCMLFSIQCISVFAGNGSETTDEIITVNLKGSWADFEAKEMNTTDNVNFSLSLNLDAGRYQFELEENDNNMSHPTTINDSTVSFSENGIKLNNTVTARCTLVTSGGDYSFNYNAESDRLEVTKKGITAPDINSEVLEITAGNEVITASKGDVFKYNVYLKADKAFEDVQTALNFDSSKLSLTATDNSEADALKNCPNLKDVSYNALSEGYVGINCTSLDGFDFTEEKIFLSLEFTVTGTGKTSVEFIPQDMTVKGGEESYYFLSAKQSEGATFRSEFEKEKEIIPTDPTTPIIPDQTEATEPDSSNATEPTESTVPTDSTEPTGTTSTVPATSSEDEVTTATSPSESETASATGTTTTIPEDEFDLGDVNRDGKLNIRDATLIQKFLAKISALDDEQIALADYQTDGKVNIKDATKIQKKLANLL